MKNNNKKITRNAKHAIIMRSFKKLTKCGCISKVCILIFPSVNNVIILSLRQSEKLRHNNTCGKKAK